MRKDLRNAGYKVQPDLRSRFILAIRTLLAGGSKA